MHATSAQPLRCDESLRMGANVFSYVQFVFNASLVVGFLYIAVQFVLAVRNDVKDRIEEYSVGAYDTGLST